MKPKIIIAVLLVLFISCQKKNPVTPQDTTPDTSESYNIEESIDYIDTDAKITENYPAPEFTGEKFDSIVSASNYFFKEKFPIKTNQYNMQAVAAHFTNYRLINQKTERSNHGSFYTIYYIEGDHYTVDVWDTDTTEKYGYKIYPTKFAIREANCLHLFPYQTMDEYLASDFGKLATDNIYGEDTITEDSIMYDGGEASWGNLLYLKFRNGLLESLEYEYRMD